MIVTDELGVRAGSLDRLTKRKVVEEETERRENGGDLEVRVKALKSLITELKVAIRSSFSTTMEFRELGFW